MGTSSSQRSPATEEWEHVRDAYQQGITDPAEISRRVVQALRPETRARMSGAGPAMCLDTLLRGAESIGQEPMGPPFDRARSALDGLSALRMHAERRLATGPYASRYSDIALDALGTSALQTFSSALDTQSLTAFGEQPIMSVASAYADRPLHQLTGSFLSADLERCFQYFVSRDISEFVGSGAFPTVRHAQQLVENVGRHCRSTSVRLPLANYEDRLQQVVRQPDAEARPDRIQDVFSDVLGSSLDEVAGG